MSNTQADDKLQFRIIQMKPRLSALVVDDDRVSRKVITAILNGLNVECIECDNGLDAIF